MGVCTWSPPLDEVGNSFRGVEICRRLGKTFALHVNDINCQGGKIDPFVNLEVSHGPRQGTRAP